MRSGHLLLALLEENVTLSFHVLSLFVAPNFIGLQEHVLISDFYVSLRFEIVLTNSVLFIRLDSDNVTSDC